MHSARRGRTGVVDVPRLLESVPSPRTHRSSSRRRSRSVPTTIKQYEKKWQSELCRNCVRSPRKHPQTPTFTGSHQEAFCGGKSLNRLCEEMFRCCSMQLAGIVFQACSIDHADISPLLESTVCGRPDRDYRIRLRLLNRFLVLVCIQWFDVYENGRSRELCKTS